MTDPLGQSQVLPYIKGLSKHGYSFHLISFEKSDKFNKHKRLIQGICDEDNIEWHPQYYDNQGGLFSTLKQVRKLKIVSRYLHQKHQFEIIHCRSYISALIGLSFKKKYGTKFVFDMRGFWADERVDGGLWNLKSPIYNTIYKYFKRKEIRFFKESDYTISLTENGKNEILSWDAFKSHTPKIKIIPCCVDLRLFDPLKATTKAKEGLQNKLGISPDDYVLGYVGSIGTWYMLSEMLDYFKVLKEHKANAKFLFITGESKEFINEKAQAKGVSVDDIIVTSVLHFEVPLCISIFDKSIFFIRSTFSKKASSPTKQGEIMAMGVPLVCNPGIGDTDEIVYKYKSGQVITYFTEAAYESIIKNDEPLNTELVIQGAKEYFSLEEGVQRYLSVYHEIEK
ncbi:MAG: glycosyltransferase involved in cell wall biosynthesis [Salibacteraceae bacterium]|jgi:glycosyltransferase involved in cell wall biosynthesis